MTKAIPAALLLLGALLSGCKIGGEVEGNVIDRRFDNGVYEIQVADTLEQDQSNAPWLPIDAAYWESCNIGAQYPQCEGEK